MILFFFIQFLILGFRLYRVEGNVRKPGRVQWRENLPYTIVLAVGVIRIWRFIQHRNSTRIRNANVDEANHDETTVFNVDLANQTV